MRNVRGLLAMLMMVVTGTLALGGGPGLALAADQKVNACGCYRDAVGSCFCGKSGKRDKREIQGRCSCPGECEPKGCEEKRAKELEKEVQAETRRARDAEKKQDDAYEARKKKDESVNNEEETAAAARLESAQAETIDESAAGAPSKKNKHAKREKEREKEKGKTPEKSGTDTASQ